jgi:hypothetical protein
MAIQRQTEGKPTIPLDQPCGNRFRRLIARGLQP